MATILLVDDEKILRTLIGVALRRQDHTVIEAGSGRRAIEQARKHGAPLDLLIADFSLPRMSGLELAAKLQGENPRMAALLLARNPRPARLEQPAETAGCGVLREPFHIRDLIGEVARLLDLPEGTRMPPASSHGADSEPGRAVANGDSQP